MQTKRLKFFPADMTVDEGGRSVLSKISTEAIDRDGEVLIADGCDTSEFSSSPTVFFNHDYNQPVGKCVGLTKAPGAIIAKTQMADRPPSHQGEWFPDTLLSLFKQGVVNGFSVGFAPQRDRQPTKSDRLKFGDAVKRVYSRWKMLEYSVAPLPANQEALALAVSKSIGTADSLKLLFPDTEMPKPKKRKVFIVINRKPKTRPKMSPADIAAQAISKARGVLIVKR